MSAQHAKMFKQKTVSTTIYDYWEFFVKKDFGCFRSVMQQILRFYGENRVNFTQRSRKK